MAENGYSFGEAQATYRSLGRPAHMDADGNGDRCGRGRRRDGGPRRPGYRQRRPDDWLEPPADHDRLPDRGEDLGGLFVALVDDRGVRYYASHLASVSVGAGQTVAEGDQIGTVGDTGNAAGTGCHIHSGCRPHAWPYGRTGAGSPRPNRSTTTGAPAVTATRQT